MRNRVWFAVMMLLGFPLVARGGEGPTVVITDPVDLTVACGAKSSDAGVHGGTQGRICRTEHGTYAAYLGEGAEGRVVIHLIRIRDGRPERLASLPTTLTGANGAHVVCGPDQEVFVVAAGVEVVDGRERASLVALHVDRTTGATTEHVGSVPFGRGGSFGYGAVFLDAGGRSLYALYSGGDAPGYFAWVRFDMARRRWSSDMVVADLGFRHCYSYGFVDGAEGALILSERDVRIETVGVFPTDPGRDPGVKYVWDELRVFQVPDLTRPDYQAVDVEAAVYDKPAGLYPSVQNNSGGDAFIDAAKRLHVLYRSTDNNRTRGGFNRHAILDAGPRVVANELLDFQESASLRMFQSRAGRHYIVAVPYSQPARVQVWEAVDAEGRRFKPAAEKRLGAGVNPSYAGLVVSCPRNGSIQDDVVDALLPSGHDYYHFRVELK